MKTILLDLDSTALGDTICFMPCAEFFRQKNNLEVYVKINDKFKNLFIKSYPNLKYYDDNLNYDKKITLNYEDYSVPMQVRIAKQLGFFNWSYIRPKVDKPDSEKTINKKYVTSSTQSTSQLKYWNNPLGEKYQPISPYWSTLFKKIKKDGLLPVVVDRDSSFGVPPYRNGTPSSCVKKLGLPLDETINLIYHSEFFIGLSSGLSWLAHALGKPVVMISNFTEDWYEFDLNEKDYIRITNTNVCHGCWNKILNDNQFDKKNWYWCPEHKGTNRQFECHYSITPDYVYNKIKHLIK